ncbi:MAG: sulfur carrier protein ThiS [Clostridia bacterium]|nr:sulfur carrier protein ThiS [Clostridia bacterium]
MKLKVNGKEELVDDGLTILGLLEKKGIKPMLVVVEHNFEVPERENWGNIKLAESDNLEIVKFIGGG